MDLRDYLRIARQRWVSIALTTVLGLAMAVGLTMTATPQYASSARVFFSTAATTGDAGTNAYQGGMAATQRVTSYAGLVTDGELTGRVIDSLGLDLTRKQLAKKITASAQPSTVVLSIRVEDASATRARTICRAVVTQLLRLVEEIETPPGRDAPLLKGTVVGPPTLAGSPATPKPVRNLALGLVLGLLAGCAVAVARELLDATVRSTADVAKALDAPLLGTIAQDADLASTRLITDADTHAPRVEAFRVLRTNVSFLSVDSRQKVFAVTSSMPEEGKSTIAANLALAMASAGQRVLLVDADLRRPQVARLLGLEPTVGVTTVLAGRVEVEDAIQVHHASGLHALTSGRVPPNPAELLQSQAMRELLALLRAEFDVVVIDSPPLLPVTDAAVLAEQTDGAVVVVRHGRTTREQLSASRARLAGVGATTLGVVLNRVKATRGSEYGAYGYGYAPTAEQPEERADEVQAPVQAAAGVAEVLPITGRVGVLTRKVRSRTDLADTGTTAPGRHRG